MKRQRFASLLIHSFAVFSLCVIHPYRAYASPKAAGSSSPGKFTVLHSFGHKDGSSPEQITLDQKGNLYGITCAGGAHIVSGRSPDEGREPGTVFELTPSGAFKTVFAFKGGYGVGTPSSLALGRDGALYGTSDAGGVYGGGTEFRLTPFGKLTILHSFRFTGEGSAYCLLPGLDGNFYGIKFDSLFKMTSTGKLTTLISPEDTPQNGIYIVQGLDGNIYCTAPGRAWSSQIYEITSTESTAIRLPLKENTTVFTISPTGTLTARRGLPDGTMGRDGNFYGTSDKGNRRSIFKISPSGTTTTIYSGSYRDTYDLNNLVPYAGELYGFTWDGGSNGDGTIFKLSLSGKLTVLHSFGPGRDGELPRSLILGKDGSLYGTTSEGGVNHGGTLFKYTP